MSSTRQPPYRPPSTTETILQLAKEFLKEGAFDKPAMEVKASRAKPKQEIARRALKKVYRAGLVPAEESNKRLIQRVVKQLKDDGQWPKDDGTRPVSAESILRAAKRK